MEQAKLSLEEKQKLFEQNPERFIDQEDLAFAVMKETFAVLNQCENPRDIFMTKGYALESLDQRLQQMRYAQAKQKQTNGIIIPR